MSNKTAVRGRDLFARYKFVFDALTSFYRLFPLKFRKKMFEKHRFVKGKLGLGLRYSLLKSISEHIGDNVAIFQGVYILNPENICIGNNVSVQPMSYIECGNTVKDSVIIGNDVSIGHGVTVMATTHNYADPNLKIRDQDITVEPVRINDNVWIGAKAVILSGNTVETGCVIGAGSVVTKSTEPEGVYVGIPSKRVKDRIQ